MATLGTNVVTYADWAKVVDPSGKSLKIIDMLSQNNPILEKMHVIQTNQPTSHITSLLVQKPETFLKKYNEGTQSSKALFAQNVEGLTMMETWSNIDAKMAELNGNKGNYLLSQQQPFMASMNEKMVETLFYGNASTTPSWINGLAVRYNSLTGTNKDQVLSAGGSGSDNASIWLISFSENTIAGLAPKGSDIGLKHTSWGKVVQESIVDSNTVYNTVYRDQWEWTAGLAVMDRRYAIRICNIDVSSLIASATGADLISKMRSAIIRIPEKNLGSICFYMNATVFEGLTSASYSDLKAGGGVTTEVIGGKIKYSFMGVEIAILDGLLNTEAAVA